MPIGILPVKLGKKGYKDKKFSYSVVLTIPKQGRFPKHLLADTIEEAEAEFKKFSKLLNNLARSYANKYGLDRADLFGEAVLGLAEAKRDFDPKRNTNFKTFAIYKIKDAIHKYVRSFVAPVTIPSYLEKISRWVAGLESILKGTMLEQDEINSILFGEKDVMLSSGEHNRYLSLKKLISKEAERLNISQKELVLRARTVPKEVAFGEYTVDTEESLYARILVEKLKGQMTDLELGISNLIMEGKTLEEIGKTFGHSAPWVVQQLQKMRKRLSKFKED